ncbi:hypothetical protein Hanom_Chr09g00849281 [Helianthus anomalus]
MDMNASPPREVDDDVQIKEEGLLETLDYRVFLVDDSCKKVVFFVGLIMIRCLIVEKWV